jgi:menaquinol-cytochrome c reductase iron-sulfur subunit
MAEIIAKSVDVPVVPPQRRNFFAEAAAVIIGGFVGLFPFAASLASFFDPLRRSGGGTREIRVTTLASVPDDGVPRSFPIIADQVDAWTTYPSARIGAVYLRRTKGSSEIEALNATCPHAGCFVGYVAAKNLFQCPCHTSAFDVEGKRRLDLSRVPPRDMDKLVAEVRGDEVWVKFQEFRTGIEDQIPKA